MAIPPNIELRLRFDARGKSVIGDVRSLRLVSNQIVALEAVLEKLDESAVPPAFNAIDVTGWTARWIAKLDIDDVDGLEKWDIAGSIVAPATGGRFLFSVPKATVNFLVDHGYSELVFFPSGADPEIRIPLVYSLTKQVLAI